MSLFDKEFYPTPKSIAVKMAEPYAKGLGVRRILEPSAGNGAILDTIVNDGIPYEYTTHGGAQTMTLTDKARRENIYTLEKDPELQLILQQKGYRVLGNDFLAFRPDHVFDLVLMNPPFSQGARHLLHAWDILPAGDIACLLNAETLRNPCTRERELLAGIVAAHGSAEELGRCFADSDHDTDVEVVLVRLHKDAPADGPFTLRLDGCTTETRAQFTQEGGQQLLANPSRLDAMLRAWDLTKSAAVDFINSYRRLYLFASTFLPDKDGKENGNLAAAGIQAICQAIQGNTDEKTAGRAYNAFLDDVKSCAWNTIISQLGLEKYMTGAMRETMREFRNAQAAFELSKENIMRLFQTLMGNLGNIMDKCVSDVYDLFTRYHDGNTACTEGWKTNKQFKANRTVILPGFAGAGFMPQKYGYNSHFSLQYDAARASEDIDKAMCWLTGTSFESLDDVPCTNGVTGNNENMTISATVRSIPVGDQGWHPSQFFLVKAYKKGTVHLQFRDEALWTKFNLTVNKQKNLIGDNLS